MCHFSNFFPFNSCVQKKKWRKILIHGQHVYAVLFIHTYTRTREWLCIGEYDEIEKENQSWGKMENVCLSVGKLNLVHFSWKFARQCEQIWGKKWLLKENFWLNFLQMWWKPEKFPSSACTKPWKKWMNEKWWTCFPYVHMHDLYANVRRYTLMCENDSVFVVIFFAFYFFFE